MTLPVPKKAQGQSKSHARSKVQEKEIAKRIGGKVTPGSGSKYQKGDVRLKGFVRVEAKTTKHASFSVTTKLIDKLEQETFGSGEIPIFEIELGGGTHTAIVLPKDALELITEFLQWAEEQK